MLPIEDVFVFDLKLKSSFLSDVKGKIMVEGISESDTLILQHPSFQKRIFSFEDLESKGWVVFMEPSVYQIDPFVISARKSKERTDQIPVNIKVIGPGEIQLSQSQNSAELIERSGGVFIQRSQMGGGSPIIRGFEANRVLLVIDGVRMNNAIYRSGHLQTVLTVDQQILDHAEVVFGPGSVTYGSDAIGGVLHFYTKDPFLSGVKDSLLICSTSFARFSSVNNETSVHANSSMGWNKLGVLSSLTYSKFDDLQMGKKRVHGYSDFGKVHHYAQMISGKDSMVVNPDPNIQKNVGYNQLDLFQKWKYAPSKNQTYLLNTQVSVSSDIPRFDRLNDYKNGELKYADWHYGPQKRLFSAFQSKITTDNKLFQKFNSSLYFQQIEESRIERKFGSTQENNRIEQVNIFGSNLDFIWDSDSATSVFYGAEGFVNYVNSNAFILDKETGLKSHTSTRYPDGGSEVYSAAVYINLRRNLGSRSILNAGCRINKVVYESSFLDSTLILLPFNKLNFNNNAVSGSLGINHKMSNLVLTKLIISTGFRAPNVDDYGKIFEKNGNVVIPTDSLKPEYAYNAEWVLDLKPIRKTWKTQFSVYYTLLQNAIVRRNSQLQGKDSILYDGEMARIQTNINTDKAVVYGASFLATGELTSHLSFSQSLNYTYGQDLSNNLPLGHIPPLFGKTGFIWKSGKWMSELFSLYSDQKPIDMMSPGGEDNEDESTADGFPGWFTLNLSQQIKLSDYFEIQAGIFNILDHHYKAFSSGISAPGRNVTLTIKSRF